MTCTETTNNVYTYNFLEKLKKDNPKVYESIETIGVIENKNSNVTINTKYGVIYTTPNKLLTYKTIPISTAKDKTDFIIKRFQEVHGTYYDYSLVKYIRCSKLVDIVCPIHGKFSLSPNSHLSKQKTGCAKCWWEKLSKKGGWSDTIWQEKASKSKHFDSFKCYIIKCWNENESFYKIGKTFTTIKRRFYTKGDMPYKYRVLKVITGSGKEISNIERKLHKSFKNIKYLPKINFHGMGECYKYK